MTFNHLAAALLLIAVLRWLYLRRLRERDYWRWYDIYLRSPHWRIYRTLRKALALYRCHSCGWRWVGRSYLQVHHLNYKRLGHERLSDTQVLCHDDHQIRHGRRF